MKKINQFIIERLRLSKNDKVINDFWPNKYCTQDEICELAKKAFDNLAFKPEDVQCEISQYKDYDDLATAYDNDSLEYYSEFETELYNLLESNPKFRYCDSIMDQVWLNINDLIEAIKNN